MLLFCPSWSCTVICCINRFTSLCKNLFNLLEFSAGAFRYHVHHFKCLTVSVELPQQWKWCTWHRKAFAKNSSKLNKFLHSQVKLSIQLKIKVFPILILFAVRLLSQLWWINLDINLWPIVKLGGSNCGIQKLMNIDIDEYPLIMCQFK